MIQTTLAQAEPILRSLPAAAHILVALGLGAGLVLWLCGRVVLRPLFGVFGALIGGAVGFLALPGVGQETVFGFPSPYAGLVIGGVIGLVLAIVLYRFALAIAMALVLGLVAVLAAGVYLDSQPLKQAAATAREALPKPPALKEAERLHIDREHAKEAARTAAGQVRQFLDQRGDSISAAWSQVPVSQRVTIVIAGLAGVLGGFFVGLLMPKRSAAAATALLGSALWLPCLGWILAALGTPWADITQRQSLVWLAIWLGVAAVGFIVQVSGLGRHAATEE
jgi:uncharacterized membrane protein